MLYPPSLWFHDSVITQCKYYLNCLCRECEISFPNYFYFCKLSRPQWLHPHERVSGKRTGSNVFYVIDRSKLTNDSLLSRCPVSSRLGRSKRRAVDIRALSELAFRAINAMAASSELHFPCIRTKLIARLFL